MITIFHYLKWRAQSGILSPRLFSFINLTDKLISCHAGYHFNDIWISHVIYADDICLFAPTASAMQYSLDACYDYGIEHDTLFNPIKLVCTIFKLNYYKLYLPTVFIGSGALITRI